MATYELCSRQLVSQCIKDAVAEEGADSGRFWDISARKGGTQSRPALRRAFYSCRAAMARLGRLLETFDAFER